jgi:DNA polymerase-3 subunit epsilon
MSEYQGYKLCFIDVETTGTDRKLHNIFQLSGRIVSNEGEVLDKFNFKFKPFSLEHYEDGALEQTGMTIADLEALPMTANEAFAAFITVLEKHCNRFDKTDKMQFVAYNAGFDNEFVRAFFEKMGDNYFGSWFWNPPICVMQAMALFLIRVRGAIPNFKLATLCKCAELGWDESKAHDADYDIEQTMRLFNYVEENTRAL